MKQHYLWLVAVLFLCPAVWAQNVTVKGKVTAKESGEPLPGVSILVKGTTSGTVTNNEGNYTLSVPSSTPVLIFSFVGYSPQEVLLAGRSVLDVSLESNDKKLDEVVVIGYGTVAKRDLTGSVTTVKGTDLLRNVPTSINQSLQGQIAGVNVNKGDGAPGGGISMTIRGANSFTGSEPLYVIDGIPFTSAATPAGAEGSMQTINFLANMNPQDIESIEVLKDASATAIYGSRGANGVVLITTKKGKAGKDRVEFTTNLSVGKVSKTIPMLNAYQYALFQNEAYANAAKYIGTTLEVPFPGRVGVDPVLGGNTYLPGPEDYRNGLPEGSQYPAGFKGTNWQNEIFRPAVTQDYTLSVSGGNERGTYLISGNYLDQQGIILNSGFKRYSLQFNLDRKIGKLLQIGTNNNIAYTTYQMGKTNTSGAQPSLISSTIFFPPTYPVDDPNSAFRESLINTSNLANPYKTTQSARDMTYATRVYTTAYAQLNFTPALNFRQRMGYNFNLNSREIYYGRDLNEGRTPTNGYGMVADNSNGQLTMESILSYNQTFAKKHTINAVAAYTFERGVSEYQTMSATGFPTDITRNFNLRAGLRPSPLQNGRSDNSLMSMLGRVNYSYDGKYLFTASFRRDGSSKFATRNKWANFASVALAWNAGEEEFIKNLNAFSTLKIRSSLGQTGNQGIAPYGSLYTTTIANVPINGVEQSGYAVDNGRGLVDPNIRWETTTQVDLGADFGFMNNRLNVTVDLYKKRTRDLLQTIQIAPSNGFNTMLTNYGSVENKGLEISATGTLLQKGTFKWDLNANISFNRNKIMDLPADQFAQRLYYSYDNIFIQRNGYAIGTIYGLVEDGYYDDIAEVKADPQFANWNETQLRSKLGEIKYKNMDNNPASISESTDRTIIGSTNPNYTYGFTNNFFYKGFSLSIFFQGVQGGSIVNTNLLKVRMNQLGNTPQWAYDTRWTEENKANAKWPRADASQVRVMLFSDRYLEDASYLRLKTVNLGYTFRTPVKSVESINVYASLGNVWTLSKYSWYDPDVNSFGGDASRRGVDMNSYPNNRTITLGFKAAF
ncbi:TonB-dependent receptor [Siphonobacter sp. SORGH_AS_0500]|uniref:SusC/RagA family TonB-linked outer membrane protein n=1 Tax=Siphonobacter sp. SORGH_AS_0500 TaxID=1864824 RepID=UPI002865D077|nr:TonB-dependent receptor [Siphonobacter sp. SORGH_AS_0500]MDR6197278.1 TonB-linked SusC/RagA family outer membrane protein [Siphonobacter sp. SORGH_AS_0500]